jgi:type II secretory pathway component GspD/PulD (secretin)
MLVGGLVLVGLVAGLAAQPPKPPMAPMPPMTPMPPGELERARLDVLKALEKFRDAEAQLRQAEKRLRDLEGKAAPAHAEEGGTDTKVFALKYSDAAALAKIIAESFGGKERITISVDDRNNAIIVRGRPIDLATVEVLVQRLDQDGKLGPGPDDVFVYRLKNATAGDMAAVLSQLFGKGREPHALIVADPVTNSLLVRAREEDRRQIERLVQELDVTPAKAPPKPEKGK